MNEIERVEAIRAYLKCNKKTFASILGNSTPQSYTNFIKGTSSLSMKMLRHLKKHDNQINLDWIISGEGEMLLSTVQQPSSDIKDQLIATQQDLINQLKAQLKNKS